MTKFMKYKKFHVFTGPVTVFTLVLLALPLVMTAIGKYLNLVINIQKSTSASLILYHKGIDRIASAIALVTNNISIILHKVIHNIELVIMKRKENIFFYRVVTVIR